MNDLPLVSVIIPVYNVENYLHECLNSVLVQTFFDIEIILVDDGSTDRTGEICDEYAFRDARISVVHKDNSGVASSRNVGVNIAKGEYILFVDGDDVVDDHIVEILYDNLKKYDADISICGLSSFKGSYSGKKSGENNIIVMNNVEAVESMLYQRYFDTGPVAKLIKSSIVKNNSFPDGKVFEDLYTVYKFLNEADKVVFTPEVLYYYRQNEVSMMHKDFDYNILDELSAIDEIEVFINETHPEIRDAFLSRKFSSYCQVFGWIPNDEKDADIIRKRSLIWKFIVAYRMKMISDRKARTKNRIAAFLSFGGSIFFYHALLLNKNAQK